MSEIRTAAPQFHGSDLEKVAEYYGIRKEGIIGFAANVNPLGLSEHLKEELAKNLDCLSSYPDRDYCGLRQAIGSYTGTDWHNIMVGNGSTELISLTIQFFRPKDAVVLGPSYSEYERELSLAGSEIRFYNLKESDDFRISTEDLKEFLTDDPQAAGAGGQGYRRLLVLCNPNNPTSSAVSTAQMEELLGFCRSQRIFVMTDETYAEFAPDTEKITAIPLTEKFDNLIVLRGVSKFFAAPGLRLGYAVTGNEELKAEFTSKKNPWTVNSLAEAAGKIMFADTGYINETRRLISAERERICAGLDGIENLKYYPPYANFILVHITGGDKNAQDLFEAAIRRGMMVRNCSSFHNLDGNYFRFCFMRPEDNDRLLDCIRSVFGEKDLSLR